MQQMNVDAYLTGFVPKPRKCYEIGERSRCPRCVTGVIVRDFQDTVCLNCGLREVHQVDFLVYLEDKMIEWLVRNLPRQLFSTLDFLNQHVVDERTKYFKVSACRGVINSQVELLLLNLAKLEQQGVIKIRRVVSDYDDVIIIYDILDRTRVNKRLILVGVL